MSVELEARVSAGQEIGAQVVVMKDGEFLADVCAGFTDESHKTPVSNDTLFPVFSTGKAFRATAVLRLVERGELELDRPGFPERALMGSFGNQYRHSPARLQKLPASPRLLLREVRMVLETPFHKIAGRDQKLRLHGNFFQQRFPEGFRHFLVTDVIWHPAELPLRTAMSRMLFFPAEMRIPNHR